MHPDKQLTDDAVYFTFISVLTLMCLFAYMSEHSGYAPADDCANRIRRTLSPYQVQQMTDSNTLPARYDYVRRWCETNADYEQALANAKTYPEFPSTPDMY